MQIGLFVIALLLISAHQPQTASIEGWVVKAGTGEPVSRAQVVLSRTDGTATGSTKATTDAGGRFLLGNIPPGRYRIYATRDGYIRTEYGQRSLGGTGK